MVSSGSGYIPVTGSCESGKELSGSMKSVIFVGQLRN